MPRWWRCGLPGSGPRRHRGGDAGTLQPPRPHPAVRRRPDRGRGGRGGLRRRRPQPRCRRRRGPAARGRGRGDRRGRAEQVASRPLREWLHKQRTGRPYVTWKFATSVDGRSAAADGSSQWITSEAARADLHRRRAAADAIVVGTGTVFADNPTLTARLPDGVLVGRQPLRVVVGLREIPSESAVLSEDSPTMVHPHPRPARGAPGPVRPYRRLRRGRPDAGGGVPARRRGRPHPGLRRANPARADRSPPSTTSGSPLSPVPCGGATTVSNRSGRTVLLSLIPGS